MPGDPVILVLRMTYGPPGGGVDLYFRTARISRA